MRAIIIPRLGMDSGFLSLLSSHDFEPAQEILNLALVVSVTLPLIRRKPASRPSSLCTKRRSCGQRACQAQLIYDLRHRILFM